MNIYRNKSFALKKRLKEYKKFAKGKRRLMLTGELPIETDLMPQYYDLNGDIIK